MRCLIVGGGIAGLTLLHELVRRGVDALLLERGPRAGGVIRSEYEDGFLWEGGPDAFNAGDPAVRSLLGELGLAHRLLPASAAAKRRAVVVGGQLTPVPRTP